MSLSKIGLNSTPDIESLKKTLQHDALSYNIKQQQAKHLKKQIQKQRQIQQYQLINKRVSTQLDHEMERKREKKHQMQDVLAHDYEKQIQEKRHWQYEQVMRNRGYAQGEVENQKEQHERRSRQLARIYNAQRTFQSINPQYQQLLSRQRVSTEANHNPNMQFQQLKRPMPSNPYQQYPNANNLSTNANGSGRDYDYGYGKNQRSRNGKSQASNNNNRRVQTEIAYGGGNLNNYANFSNAYNPKPNYPPQASQPQLQLTDSKISSSSPYTQKYKDYLKQQISRKKHQKQQQAKQRLQLQKQLSRKNTEILSKQEQQLRQIKMKQKEMYRRGLDQQIAERKYFRTQL